MKIMENEISVLMNCRNGAQFLRNALDSLKNQTVSNFKLVFVDNCSSDNSLSIVKEYSIFFPIQIVKTNQDLSLGEARALGIQNCTTRFISILDTDDEYLENSLEILYNSIVNSEFAVIYGNQKLMNTDGIIYGEIINKYIGEKGNFFRKLLIHWDIPIVAVILNREMLISENINFSADYQGSEEFDFFLRLSGKFNFFSISDFVVKYRVHKSLSSNLGELREIERRMALNKLEILYPELALKYSKEFKLAYAKCEYFKALNFFNQKNVIDGRKVLRKILKIDLRYVLIYLLTFNSKLLFRILIRKYGEHFN